MTKAKDDCACEAPRMAAGVDEELRDSALKRLRRIEGQVRGLQRMLEDGRYCADILTQVASVEQALGGVSKLLLKNHLKHCVTQAVIGGEATEVDAKFDEIVELFGRHWR